MKSKIIKKVRNVKSQKPGSQNERHKNLLNNSEDRMLTPEEGSKLIQEAEGAAERYEVYLRQRRMMEEQKKAME